MLASKAPLSGKKCRKRKRLSLRRMAKRTVTLLKSAFQSLKSYPEIRRSTPVSLFDVLSAVSALGVVAATVVWSVI